jgi:hypothetical protein
MTKRFKSYHLWLVGLSMLAIAGTAWLFFRPTPSKEASRRSDDSQSLDVPPQASAGQAENDPRAAVQSVTDGTQSRAAVDTNSLGKPALAPPGLRMAMPLARVPWKRDIDHLVPITIGTAQLPNTNNNGDLMPQTGSPHFVMSMSEDLQGRIWIGTEDEGVWCWDLRASLADQWLHFTRKNTGGPDEPNGATIEAGSWLGDDNAYALACDKLGRIWVGHLNHGVSVYNGKQWKNYNILEGPLGERVFAIATCPTDGDVWIATNAGLTRYSLSKDTWSYYTRSEGLPSDQASAIAFDQAGNIIVATQCDGLALADAKDNYNTWRHVSCPQEYQDRVPLVAQGEGLPTNLINDVKVAKDGTIYVATTTGLAWSKDRGINFQFLRGKDWADKVKGLRIIPMIDWSERPPEGLPAEDFLTCLSIDPEGNVCLGMRQRGVALLRKDGTIRPTLETKPPFFPRQILRHKNTLLVASYGHGISTMDDGTSPTPSDPSQGSLSSAPFPTASLPANSRELADMLVKLESVSLQSAKPVVTLADDWLTQGQWVGRYGRYWICLAATMSPFDFLWGTGAADVEYSSQIGPHHRSGDSLRYWVHWNHTTNPGSLELPMPYLHSRVSRGLTTWSVDRRQSEWDDHSETYPNTYEGPDIYFTIRVPKGDFILSFYDMNKDGHGTDQCIRDYRLSLRSHDDSRSLANNSDGFSSMPELAHSRINDFYKGVYKRFVVTGPTEITAKIERRGSFSTILAGVMLDRLDEHPFPYVRNPDKVEETIVPTPHKAIPISGARRLGDLMPDSGTKGNDRDLAEALWAGLVIAQTHNPAWHAAESRPYYLSLARYYNSMLTHHVRDANADSAARLSSCYFRLGSYAAWEKGEEQLGALTARKIEKSLRWDGRPVSYPNEDRDLVMAFVASHSSSKDRD